MVKQVNINPVIFNPVARTLDFSAWASFDIRRLMAVINDSRNVLIYAIANNGIGLIKEFSTNTLIKLQCDTSNHASNDILTVLYDEPYQIEVTTLSLPPNASTETTLSSINTKLPSLSSGKVPVETNLTPLTDTQLRASAVPVSLSTLPSITGSISVDNFPSSQEITATSLPLPTSASTSALQITGNTSLDSINAKIPTIGQQLSSNSLSVVLASNQTALPITSGNYAQIVDDQTTYIYIGNAIVGSLSSSSVWSIKKITFSGTITKTEWASSTDLFNKIWDDRSTYTYS